MMIRLLEASHSIFLEASLSAVSNINSKSALSNAHFCALSTLAFIVLALLNVSVYFAFLFCSSRKALVPSVATGNAIPPHSAFLFAVI